MRRAAAMAMAAAATLVLPSVSLAQPQAWPPRPPRGDCTAAAPGVGATVAGPVLQVSGKDELCVALGPTPDRWVRLRVRDAAPDGSRGALMAAAFAQDVVCTITAPGPDAPLAICLREGVSVAHLAQEPQMVATAMDWR